MSSIQASVPGDREIQFKHGPRSDGFWAATKQGDVATFYFGGADSAELVVSDGHWRIERRSYTGSDGTGRLVDVLVVTGVSGNLAICTKDNQHPHANLDVRPAGTPIGLDTYGPCESVTVIAGTPIETTV